MQPESIRTIPSCHIRPIPEYLEAKAWKEDLQDSHVIQAMNYAHTEGCRWVVLSNGREWRLYDDHIQGVPAGHRLVAMARLDDSRDLVGFLTALSKEWMQSGALERFAAKARLNAMLDGQLSKPESEIIKAIGSTIRKLGLTGIQNSDIVAYFRERFETSSGNSVVTSSTITTSVPSQPSIQTSPTVPTTPPQGNSKSLAELRALGNHASKDGRTYPTNLTFPGGSSQKVNWWKDVGFEVVKWLINQRQLPQLPFLGLKKSYRWFLNTSPYQQNGNEMKNPCSFQHDNRTIYVDTNRDALDLMKCLCALCKEFGVSPSEIVVHF